MKKTISLALIFAISSLLFAKGITLTNTFGGDEDLIGADDFMAFEKTDVGSYKNASDTLVSDRFQFDAETKKLESRVRLDFVATTARGFGVDTRLRGFVKFSPIQQFSIVAGNSCFSKFGIVPALLFAADDYSNTGKLIRNGIGLLGDFDFGDIVNLKIASSIESTSLDEDDLNGIFTDIDNLDLDLGFELGIDEMIFVGTTCQNVTSGNRRVGVFAGIDLFDSWQMNMGFYYNFNDDDYLPFYDDGVEKSYKTKYALMLSTSYEFDAIPLILAADVISGLNDEYIHYADKRKVYETVKHSDGGVPFYSCVYAGYDFTDNFGMELNASMTDIFNVSDSWNVTVYPSLSYKLPEKYGTVQGGVRLNFDSDGLSSFSIPLSWKIKFSLESKNKN